MKYHLVLQFPGDSENNLEALLDLEERLIGSLGPDHFVDGHDVGSGESNIFIHSDDPSAAFQLARTLIPSPMLRDLKAAYREAAGQRYSMLWPPNSVGPFAVK